MSGAVVIFLHIPRTGGTTLRRVMLRQYEPSSVYTIRDPVEASIETFKELPQERRARVRLLTGHIPFGLHPWLSPVVTYVTLLRHPVDRIASHYEFVRRSPGHELYDLVTTRNLSLEEYAAGDFFGELDNGQARLLSGETFQTGGCSEETLALAKRNLRDHCLVAGVTERFDESLLLMKQALGWRKPVHYARQNVIPAREALPRSAVAVIEERNRFDLELHGYANTLLDAAISGREPAFLRSVRRFQRTNQLLGGLAPALRPVRRLVRRVAPAPHG